MIPDGNTLNPAETRRRFVYGLKDPETETFFYIGSTAKPKKRDQRHYECNARSQSARRYSDVIARGFIPEFVILAHRKCTGYQIYALELLTMRNALLAGHPLTIDFSARAELKLRYPEVEPFLERKQK